MKKITIAIFATLFLATITFAQKPEIFSNKSGAIKGYDPVAYFSDQKPVKGSDEISYAWHGATWHFATAENKTKFVANPEKFAPQYGGYCAYGLAKGYKVKIEPDAWSIENGKLYLNYDKGVQKDWEKDREEYIKKADENYKKN